MYYSVGFVACPWSKSFVQRKKNGETTDCLPGVEFGTVSFRARTSIFFSTTFFQLQIFASIISNIILI